MVLVTMADTEVVEYMHSLSVRHQTRLEQQENQKKE